MPDSNLSETSYFQSQMHFDDSVESIADSDLADGELRKDADFSTVCPESVGETRCIGRAREREESAHLTQADRKESLRTHSI